MKSFQRWTGITILSGVLAGVFFVGCTRDITVAPTVPVSSFNTATHTSSPTLVPTDTPSFTPTHTLSITPTPTHTPTPSHTPTPTPTQTPTPTWTYTTIIPTGTSTPTWTFTITLTPTPANLTVGAGPSSPPNSTQLPGASAVPVLQVQVVNSNSSSVTLTNVVVTAFGTGDDSTGIAGVLLYYDQDNDGVVDPSDILLNTTTFSANNGTASFTIFNIIPAATTRNYLVVYNISPSAPVGTYQGSILAGGITASVGVTGLPVGGAVITVATNTPTRTSTPTITNTGAPTATNTNTGAPTNTSTVTPTETNTGAPTDTPTVTNTPGAPVCTVTPVNPTYYSEQELVGSGGSATGTNDTCATGENPGIVSSGSDVVITGSLSSTGGGGWDLTQDQDFYLFTAGTAGNYKFALDCFSTGTDNNLLDIFIWSADGSCSYVYDPGPASPYNEVYTTAPLAAGDSVYIAIFAYDGTGPISYRLTLIPPAVGDTPTPTETLVDTDTPTPTETTGVVETDTPTVTPTTGCTPVLQTSYTFDADTECWKTNGNITGSATQYDASDGHNAPGALMAVIPFGASAGDELIQLDFTASPVAIPNGSVITLWYKASTTSGNAQLFNISGGGWQNGSWLNLPTGWTQISWIMNITTPATVNQVGLQVLNPTVPVTIWIDDVTISSPPTPTPTVSANCSPLLNGIEAMNSNGVWSGTNSSKGLSTDHATQGTYSMDVNITTAAGWNDNVLLLNGFAPADWTNVAQLKMDVYVDPALYALCGGYAQLALRASSNEAAQFYQEITADSPAMVAGQNTLTWNIDFSRGLIPAGSDLSELRFIFNNGGGTAALGHFYVDNITLVYNPCPPTPLYSWDFATDDQNWIDHTGDGTVDTGVVTSWLTAGYAGGTGAVNMYVPFTAVDQQEWLELTLSPTISIPAGSTIQMYVWIDGSVANGGFPGGQIFVQSGPDWAFEHAAWTNLTPNGWTVLTYTPPFTTGTADPTDVRRIGVQVMTGSTGTIGAGNIKVDNVIIY